MSEQNIDNQENKPKLSFMEKLKKRWGLKHGFQVIIILIVFALTGFTVLELRKVIFTLLGIDETSNGWYKTIIYLIAVLPLYQLLLLFYGFIFGQFRFFWEKEKKLFRAIKRIFVRTK